MMHGIITAALAKPCAAARTDEYACGMHLEVLGEQSWGSCAAHDVNMQVTRAHHNRTPAKILWLYVCLQVRSSLPKHARGTQ